MAEEAEKEIKVLDKQRLRTFVLGGAVGALVGILLAPRSGRELRGSLANRAGEARERGRETYFDAQEQMRERLAEAREGSRQSPDSADPPVAARTTAGAPPHSHLRDVSRDAGAVDESADREADREAERSEELRRKVRETRERLRGREGGGPGTGR